MKTPVTKTFTITADPHTMKRFEKFLCFFHYNGGHSGLFGMYFDGDGSDRLKVDPAPDKGTRDYARISYSGQDIEIANENDCTSRPIAMDKTYYRVKGDVMTKIKNGVETHQRTFDFPNT